VLLVEDSSVLRFALSRLLEVSGYEVMEAHDGSDALGCIPGFRPHLVVTDLYMPVMSGFELIERLRSDPETADLPVVAITADSRPAAATQARQAGAADVLAKPFDLSTLLGSLQALKVGLN
jgi:CheY-like chemotaxis protein